LIVQPVRAVSFDIHGTLIHSPRLGEVYAEILDRHGIETSPERAHEVVRLVWREFSCRRRPEVDLFSSHPKGSRGLWFEFIDRVCEHLGGPRPSPFAKAELFQKFAGPEPWELYDDVLEILQTLQQKGIRLVVISNWDDRLPELLEGLGLAEFFEAVIYSAGVGVEKPFPAIFERAMSELGLPAEQVLHVGDRVREDVEGARGVGMQAIHLDRTGTAGDVQDLGQLTELLPDRRSSGRIEFIW
jgi:putative hydrolase of the HAD superfamily